MHSISPYDINKSCNAARVRVCWNFPPACILYQCTTSKVRPLMMYERTNDLDLWTNKDLIN